jgi:hypothetical protein
MTLNKYDPTALKQQEITIELPHGRQRNIVRNVHNVHSTGHIAHGWQGTEFYQWAGQIILDGVSQDVWGYSQTYGETPVEWANDTY